MKLHLFGIINSNQCKRTRQRPGDGLDNDCDGKIDEEVRDGKDNDGDGEVDEDVELVRARTTMLEVASLWIELARMICYLHAAP